jgi:hypothetical protein
MQIVSGYIIQYYLQPTMCSGYSRPLADHYLTITSKKTSITGNVRSDKSTLIKDKLVIYFKE